MVVMVEAQQRPVLVVVVVGTVVVVVVVVVQDGPAREGTTMRRRMGLLLSPQSARVPSARMITRHGVARAPCLQQYSSLQPG